MLSNSSNVYQQVPSILISNKPNNGDGLYSNTISLEQTLKSGKFTSSTYGLDTYHENARSARKIYDESYKEFSRKKKGYSNSLKSIRDSAKLDIEKANMMVRIG